MKLAVRASLKRRKNKMILCNTKNHGNNKAGMIITRNKLMSVRIINPKKISVISMITSHTKNEVKI